MGMEKPRECMQSLLVFIAQTCIYTAELHLELLHSIRSIDDGSGWAWAPNFVVGAYHSEPTQY